MHDTARAILAQAKTAGCEIVLPVDAVVAEEFRANPPTQTVAIGQIPAGSMMLDVGPATVAALVARLPGWRTLVWERPARRVRDAALRCGHGGAGEGGGGGDRGRHAAQRRRRRRHGGRPLRQAGVMERLSYVSSAGGAFLEWLEGKTLPGVAVLMAHTETVKA